MYEEDKTWESRTVDAVERLAAEHALWRVLARADRFDDAAIGILDEVCRRGNWPIGILWMLDQQTGTMRFKNLHHNSPRDLSKFIEIAKDTEFAKGMGLPGRTWECGAPCWIEDIGDQPGFPRAKLVKLAGIKSGFGFPIKLNDEVLGVMTFYSPELRDPDRALLETMDVMVAQIGNFIARVRAQEALRAGEERWHRIWSGSPIGIFHSIPGGKLMDVNPAFAEILGFESPEQIIEVVNRTSIPETLYVDAEQRRHFIERLQESRGQWVNDEVLFRRTDGTVLTVQLLARTIENYQGESVVIEGFLVDLTERKKIEIALQHALEKVRELTLRDHLTGLHNRRHLEERMEIEIAAAQRSNDEVSMVIFDIDHFKEINDTYGHSVGDVVLQLLASTLGSDVRPGDVLARYGGEEFVLLMRQTGPIQAMEVAERLRSIVEKTVFETPEGDLRITISCGVASISECGQGSRLGLVNMADDRMYQAKEMGRNRVVGPR